MRRAEPLQLRKQNGDLDPAVTWREGPEARDRFFELALGPDPAAAPGLVPRHRDVHQALKEVSLARRGRAPDLLELFVGGEILALSDEPEPLGEAVVHPNDPNKGLSGHGRPRYPPAVATILLCGVDVYFRGKLEALLPGHHFVTTDSADWPDLVIADISRVDPMDVADSYPEIPILGFGGHTDTAGLRRAHEAGFDQVLVKNALQERAAQIVEELTA